jgi:hypothetical protein
MMFSAICGSVSAVISFGLVISKSPRLTTAFSNNRQGIAHANNLMMIYQQARDLGAHTAAGRETPSPVRKMQCGSGPHRCQDFGNLRVQSIESPGLGV